MDALVDSMDRDEPPVYVAQNPLRAALSTLPSTRTPLPVFTTSTNATPPIAQDEPAACRGRGPAVRPMWC